MSSVLNKRKERRPKGKPQKVSNFAQLKKSLVMENWISQNLTGINCFTKQIRKLALQGAFAFATIQLIISMMKDK